VIAPISVCLIVRDETAQLEKCLSSVRPHVAEIVIVDTGSVDGSQDIARRYADRFESYSGCNHPSGLMRSFADARQKSFSLATQPWTMWIDGDDEVVGAEHLASLVEEYDRARNGAPSMAMMLYEYAHDERGRVIMVHERERLVAPKDAFQWVGRVHEVLVPLRGDVRQKPDKVKIVHRRDLSRKKVEPGRNLRILKEQYEDEGDKDARHLYYLGLEYGNCGFVDDAIKFLAKYVDRSGWDDEKYLACIRIADHHIARGEYAEAVPWATRATTIKEKWGEAYFTLSKCFYHMANGGKDPHRNWERCAHFAQHGLSLPRTETTLFVNPFDRDLEVHKFLNVALSKTGRVEEALQSVMAGLSAKSDEGHLLINKAVFEKYLAKQKLTSALSSLMEAGGISREVRAHVTDVVEANQVPSLQESSPSARPAGSLDVVFYVGPGVEAWNPETASKNGIGGSETAVIEMSKRLASRGHKVRVFNDCSGMEGTFGGVEYSHFSKYGSLSCDVLVSSRKPSAVDDGHKVSARARLCWVHDVHCGPELTHARALRIDRFLTLSQWHRDYFLAHHSCVHPDQVLVTRNGIDLSRFDRPVVRDSKRAVYSSSPDRGMQVAICVWPRVRERIPGAELHVFYGFQTWEACADDNQRRLIANLKQMLKDYETAGVVFHGRVSQDELASEYLKSSVWPYPTWFTETSCISAMEAHAAGVRMVTSPIAALNETVGPRGTMVAGDWLSLDYQNRFIDAVVEAMDRPGDDDRKKLQEHARKHFGWDSLADEWIVMFRDVIDSVARDVMPPYKGIL